MNIIALDPSLTCTALVVNDKKFVYTGSHVATTPKGKYKAWFEKIEDLVTIRHYDFEVLRNLSHADSELAKFNLYHDISQDIVNDIASVVDGSADYVVGIEGYSYSSAAGPLIDLVTYGSILRYTLRTRGFDSYMVIPPQELKTKAASLVYEKEVKGKKTTFRNNSGVAAGSFTKKDMLVCLMEDSQLASDTWVSRLMEYETELKELKSVPKPLEDINDAKLLYEWIKRK